MGGGERWGLWWNGGGGVYWFVILPHCARFPEAARYGWPRASPVLGALAAAALRPARAWPQPRAREPPAACTLRSQTGSPGWLGARSRPDWYAASPRCLRWRGYRRGCGSRSTRRRIRRLWLLTWRWQGTKAASLAKGPLTSMTQGRAEALAPFC